jgi:two-component system OmpR family response regulator
MTCTPPRHDACDCPTCQAASSGTKPRVLVVDDDEHIRNAVARLLRHQGFEASTAVDGEHALKRLRTGEHFDGMTVDLMMPGLGGKEFITILREEALFPLQRVLILTAVHNADNATAYIQYGCAGYCGKPWDTNRLLTQVARICCDNDSDTPLRAVV